MNHSQYMWSCPSSSCSVREDHTVENRGSSLCFHPFIMFAAFKLLTVSHVYVWALESVLSTTTCIIALSWSYLPSASMIKSNPITIVSVILWVWLIKSSWSVGVIGWNDIPSYSTFHVMSLPGRILGFDLISERYCLTGFSCRAFCRAFYFAVKWGVQRSAVSHQRQRPNGRVIYSYLCKDAQLLWLY